MAALGMRSRNYSILLLMTPDSFNQSVFRSFDSEKGLMINDTCSRTQTLKDENEKIQLSIELQTGCAGGCIGHAQ